MQRKKIKYLTIVLMLLSSMLLTGCIPANEHVGKPAAHSYKDSSYGYGYGGGYYSRPYNGDYYYR